MNNVIVNISGTKGDVSPELMEVIRYLRSGKTESPFTKELDEEVASGDGEEER